VSTSAQCQAKRKNGSPCPNPASHTHETDTHVLVYVCGTHLRMLHRRERSGSDEEKLAAWGITPAPVPSPGQTTPLTAVSPPIPVDG
jgi:hypothetical protein